MKKFLFTLMILSLSITTNAQKTKIGEKVLKTGYYCTDKYSTKSKFIFSRQFYISKDDSSYVTVYFINDPGTGLVTHSIVVFHKWSTHKIVVVVRDETGGLFEQKYLYAFDDVSTSNDGTIGEEGVQRSTYGKLYPWDCLVTYVSARHENVLLYDIASPSISGGWFILDNPIFK